MFLNGFLFAFNAFTFLLGFIVGLISIMFILLLIYGFFFASHHGDWWIKGFWDDWKRGNK
jgi:hypothetical protein